ncbi:EF-P 5-aminopentanol modification-associated protein YfmF [Streptococcus caprae]|uniref:EF-P 5-aminopentanol modification-associated protein YfmF n=1 Tax=Streptococcus caprae TaxID=1640501 RepID=A0ABV8CW06_9STRE
MRIVDGVNLHFIKTKKFKSNHLTFRFSGELDEKGIAKRALVAQMMATANSTYPTSQVFRKKLSNLYGASFSTHLSRRGRVHILDIDINFVGNSFALNGENILKEIMDFLYEVLYNPLTTIEQYQSKTFDLEKTNLIQYLETDQEDHFYYSDLELNKLFYDDVALQVSKYGSTHSIEAENSYTAYQEFRRMLSEDKIDIFLLGNFDDYHMLQLVHQFPFEPREKELEFLYHQDYVNVTREKIEQIQANQSILELGYYFPRHYGDDSHFALIVFNGLIGAFSHSLLFTNVRESESLAYNIGSQFDIFTGMFRVYAGIDKENRGRVMQLITQQINAVKQGRFSATLLKQTKNMLKTNAKLSVDNPKSLIEMEYSNLVMGNQAITLAEWIERIEKVTKEDILTIANQVKLQAVYFLEGV